MAHKELQNPHDTVAFSVVIPAYNEEESLPELHAEIVNVMEYGFCGTAPSYEIIVVDDGSTDGTERICQGLSPLRYVRIPHNSGQTAALRLGFEAARSAYVAALDADGQNDPADIPKMLNALQEEGLDVICGWRVHRRDTLGKRIASCGAFALRQLFLHDGIRDSGCTLKVFRRECLEGLHLERGDHRFIPALLMAQGYSVGEIPVNHRPRMHGHTKYGASRMVDGLRDLVRVRRILKSSRALR